jgi:O-antigen ligase
MGFFTRKLKNSYFFGYFFWLSLALSLALDCFSAAAFSNVGWEGFCLIFLVVLAFFVTFIKFEYGVYIILLELIVGGQGYLFFYSFYDFKISLRLALFLAIFSAWLIKVVYQRDFLWLKDKRIMWFFLFFLFIAWAIIFPLVVHRPIADVFFDANGYLFFGLIGLFLTAKPELKKVSQILLAGSLATSLKTIFVLFLFSQNYAEIGNSWLYHWLRDTRVAEITLIFEPLYRVFFQSHLYNLLAILLVVAYIFLSKQKLSSHWQTFGLVIILWLNFLTLLISQSRGPWLAGIVAIIFLFILLFYYRVNFKKILLFIFIWPLLIISCHLVINLIINNFSINLFYSRLGEGSNQAGVSSRQAQIGPALAEIKESPFWGHGFGQTITYLSSDPRIKNENNPTGLHTTYALELGYLDMVIKFGLLGVLAYFLFIDQLIKKWRLLIFNNPQNYSWIIGLLVILLVNIFSPYLNHPLGIGYLLLLYGLTNNYQK